MSNVIKQEQSRDVANAQFFDENVFYPRMYDREKEIKAAHSEALKIVQDAEQQAIRNLDKFRQEGIKKGLEDVHPLKGQLAGLIAEMKQFKASSIASLESIVVKLACTIARRIVRAEITLNPDIVRQTTLTALKTLVNRRRVVLYMHPDDAARMKTYQEDIMRSFRDMDELSIEAHADIERGGCYIKTECGELDATVETQCDQLLQACTVINP